MVFCGILSEFERLSESPCTAAHCRSWLNFFSVLGDSPREIVHHLVRPDFSATGNPDDSLTDLA